MKRRHPRRTTAWALALGMLPMLAATAQELPPPDTAPPTTAPAAPAPAAPDDGQPVVLGEPPPEGLGGVEVDEGQMPLDEDTTTPDTTNQVAMDPSNAAQLDGSELEGPFEVIASELPIEIIDPDEPIKTHEQGYIDETLDENAPDSPNTAPTSGSPPPDSAGANLPESNISTLVKSFEGLAATGWRPPDTVVTVGQDKVLEATNSGFAVYDMRGTLLQSYTSFASLFSSALPSGWGGNLFDPRVSWNTYTNQFVMLAIGTDNVAQTSYSFIAVSKTADPTGAWWLYRIANNGGHTDSWMDYATLGVDQWGVYFAGNMFMWVGGYKTTQLYSYGTGILSGSGSSGVRFSGLSWPTGGSAASLQYAKPHSVNGDSESFFVNSFSGSGNKLLLWRLGGTRTAAATTTLTRAEVSLGTRTYYGIGNNVDQPGTTTDVDGGDARIMNAAYVNRHVFTTLTNDDLNNASRAGPYTAALDTNANTLVWDKSLVTTGNYYIYPAVTAYGSDRTGPAGLYMSWFSGTQFGSTVYKVYDDPAASGAGDFIVYKSGVAAYDSVFGGRNRWGDYSGADYDWKCTGRMWGAAEWANTGNNWATRIAAVKMKAADADCPFGAPPVLNKIAPTGSITDNTPTYSWTAHPDATSYYLYVNDTTGNIIFTNYTAAAAGCSSGSGTCSITPSETVADGAASWWISGNNSQFGQGPWGSSMSFTVTTATVPPAATLVSPSGTWSADNTPNYTWNAVSNSTWYYLWVQNTTTGEIYKRWYTAAASGCSSGTGTCSIEPYYPLVQGPYTWWIRTYNNLGNGPWSSGLSFNMTAVGGPPPMAILVSPLSGSTTDSTPTYRWNARAGVTYYGLYVSDSGGLIFPGSGIRWVTAGAAGCAAGTGVCQYTPSETVSNGTVSWWVQTYNPTAYGPWSYKGTFTKN